MGIRVFDHDRWKIRTCPAGYAQSISRGKDGNGRSIAASQFGRFFRFLVLAVIELLQGRSMPDVARACRQVIATNGCLGTPMRHQNQRVIFSRRLRDIQQVFKNMPTQTQVFAGAFSGYLIGWAEHLACQSSYSAHEQTEGQPNGNGV
ncbi:hypothetical protein [Paraburkholderia sp. 2C]